MKPTLDENGRLIPRDAPDNGLFSGILFCADCGSVMYQQRCQTDKRRQDCYIPDT